MSPRPSRACSSARDHQTFVPIRPALESTRASLLRSRCGGDGVDGSETERAIAMKPGERRLCDDHEIIGLIASMARKIADGRRADVPLCLVGVRTRGVPLAERLAESCAGWSARTSASARSTSRSIATTWARRRRWPVLRGTEIPFNVDGAEVVLVDDVLFTGRTVRAALNAICDLGRPACVRLAVLVDRGHRELPIQPDVVGL